jgi:hypothetical protein
VATALSLATVGAIPVPCHRNRNIQFWLKLKTMILAFENDI